MSILVVDDTPDNLMLLETLLTNAGYKEILKATCAKEAYECLGVDSKEKTSSQVDLILMDIMMPETNGIEAVRRIKSVENLYEIPVIMVTAKTDMDSLHEAFEAGAMDYITKPLRKIELLARVKSSLRLKKEMDTRIQREKELKARNEELETALSEIKTLRGFIPICAHCKKIRDVKGYWQQMEKYIQEHSDVKFSHGICDDCMKKILPDMGN
ncbi:MAG: response regulator [Candidatus Omnitrophica bacterium]|nr:response regulator [Candidatus Omnitrophota bacterium]